MKSPGLGRTRNRTVAVSVIVVASTSASLADERQQLLESMLRHPASPFCYLRGPDVDPADLAWFTGLYNPADHRFGEGGIDGGDRYTVDDTIWQGDGGQGASWLAMPAHLTYSFPQDGTTWGIVGVLMGLVDPETGPNDLGATFEATFGVGNADRGYEYIRQTLGAWGAFAGLTYTQVADDGAPMDQLTTRLATRGDIRIGGLGLGTADGIGAYNAFPSATILGVGGGDMLINTSFFIDDPDDCRRFLADPTNNYRLLRNLLAHEHGHGLGFVHQVPCSSCPPLPDPPLPCPVAPEPDPEPRPDYRLMEPVICRFMDMLEFDEMRATGANYGDRFAGNHTVETAHDYGDLTQPFVRSVIENYLSTNGSTATNGTDEDWFRFSISTDVDNVAIVVDPDLFAGLSYETSIQFLGCDPLIPQIIIPDTAGDLAVELRTADGMTVVDSSTDAAAGVLEFFFIETLHAGEYTIRVWDMGPNPDPDQDVQLYDLKIFLGSALTPPVAHAGIDKRIAADTNCFFMGDINSRSIEFRDDPLPASAYDWDLDGDGLFETFAQPDPMRQYPSNGVYPVTLRVSDATGFSDEHTIDVTVVDATTSLDSIVPAQARIDTSIPILITGANLKNVVSASEFSVSGADVTISGTPEPNALGTQVVGLTLNVGAGAALGARDLSVLNADGSATLLGGLTILDALCLGDANTDAIVNFADITEVLGNWLADYLPGTGPGDANGDGLVNFADITEVLSNWLATCP